MEDIIQKNEKNRLLVLKIIYEITDQNCKNEFFVDKLKNQINELNDNEIHNALDFLENKHLIKPERKGVVETFSYTISIYGIEEIERMYKKPDEATENFRPYNVIINNSQSSPIQIGTNNSSQNINYSFNSDQITKLKEFVREISEILNKHENKNEEEYLEIKADIETLQAQVYSPKPKNLIIKELLLSLKSISESTSAGIIAQQIAPYIPQVLSLIQ